MMLVTMIILFRIFLVFSVLIGLASSETGSSIKEVDTFTQCLIGCVAATYIGSEFLVMWMKNEE